MSDRSFPRLPSGTMPRALLLLVLVIASARSTAQHDTLPKWKVTTEVPQLFLVNPTVVIERVLRYGSHGLFVSYRPSLRSGGGLSGPTGLFGDYLIQNAWNWLYQSVAVGTTQSITYGRSRRPFLRIEVLYRHWWFDRKWMSYENGKGGRFEGLRSERQDVFALKALAGYSWRPALRNGKRLIVEAYGGPGVRWKNTHFITHTGTVYEEPRTDYTETDRFVTPSVHLGLRMGVAWGRGAVLK